MSLFWVMMTGMLLLVVALIVALLASISLYDKPYPQPRLPTLGYRLATAQIDDFGSFWKAGETNALLASVDAASRASNTFVVVFIHGWHHNASPDDGNLADFNKTLGTLHAQLSSDSRRHLRKQLTGDTGFELIGIYLGWRGRQLPGVLDYLTMWWRKLAAERVGDGDASEFLERLQRMYLRANAVERAPRGASIKPYMGLVTMGHSFGGQVLVKSVARSLEFALAQRAPCLAEVPVIQANAPSARARVPVNSLGDLNILLNPAVEAYQLGRIDALYRQLEYPATQTPQLVVFSASNDFPRKAYFPIARYLTSPFRPRFRNDYQTKLWGQALGVLQPQQTHVLERAAALPDSLVHDDFVANGGQAVKAFDFTEGTSFGAIRMSRRTDAGGGPAIAYSPVAVVLTKGGIIDGHNGIFREEFQQFLSSYVAFIEGKRLLGRRDRFDRLIAEGRLRPDSPAAAEPPPAECHYET